MKRSVILTDRLGPDILLLLTMKRQVLHRERAHLKLPGCSFRRRNTRYKKPQLGAQHCFVASLGRCLPFFTLHDQLVAQQKHLLRVEESCCESRARIYSEQQILASLLVFHPAHNLPRNKCARVLANQPISALHFFNPQQMFFLRVKLITQGEKRETSTKTCNETMLRDKLRVFVSRLSPPLVLSALLTKKLPTFLSRLNEILSGGCEKILPVSGSFWSNLKLLRMILLTA